MKEIEYFTVEEAALVLRVTPKTLRNWAKDGKMPARKGPGGRYLFTRGDIQDIAVRKVVMSLEKPPG